MMYKQAFYRNRKSKEILKITSILTLIFFAFTNTGTDLAMALQELPATGPYSPEASYKRSSNRDIIATKELHADTFKLPEYLGIVKDSWTAPSNRGMCQPSASAFAQDRRLTIVHIQDAHCNYACQRSISNIIEYLTREYGIEHVYLEGGKGEYDLSLFRQIPDARTRKKVSEYFMKQGEVNAVEYFAINNPGKINLWGVEDDELYLKNLKVYRDFIKYKDKADNSIKQIAHIINALKIKIFPEELLQFDLKYIQHRNSGREFKDYIKYLLKEAERHDIELSGRLVAGDSYENISLLSASLRQEKDIDFKRANTERETLIDRLLKRLPLRKLECLIKKIIEFKMGRMTEVRFYEYLGRRAAEIDVDMREEFPELYKYVAYVSAYAGIDKWRLMGEIALLEDQLRNILAGNEVQRELIYLSRNLEYLKKMFNFTLTRREYEYYLNNRDGFRIEKYRRFIDKYAPLYGIQSTLSDAVERVDKYSEELILFYEYSFKRDEAFIGNIKARQGRLHRLNQVHQREPGSETAQARPNPHSLKQVQAKPDLVQKDSRDFHKRDTFNLEKGDMVRRGLRIRSGLAHHSPEQTNEMSASKATCNLKFPNGTNAGGRVTGHGSRAAILITGGFHTENLTALFRKNNISYVSILPEFGGKESESRYFSILSGGESDLIYRIDTALSALQIASKLNSALGRKVWDERNIKLYETAVYTYTLAERGNTIKVVDDVTGEEIFSYGEGADVIRVTKNRFFYDIHEEFIDRVMGEEKEGYRDLNYHEKQAAESARREVLSLLSGEDPARQKIESINIAEFVRVSYNLSKTGRDGHVGGRGIRIRDGLTRSEARRVIRHEFLAGILKSHKTVEMVENLISAHHPLMEIRRILKNPDNRHEGYKTLWELEDRTQVERDYADTGDKKNDQPATPENIKEIFEKESYLDDKERAEIVQFIIKFHKMYDKGLKNLRKKADDRARYTVSIREIKRFAEDFKRIFTGLVAGKTSRKKAFLSAKKTALKNIYSDFVSLEKLNIPRRQQAYAKLGISADFLREDPARADISKVNIYNTAYRKLKRGLDSRIPALFIKEGNSLQALEHALSVYAGKENARVFSMQCTPYSDTSQLIGGYVPRGRVNLEAAYARVGEIIHDDDGVKKVLAALLKKRFAEISPKEIKEFRDIYKEKSFDGLIIAAGMVLEFPHNWQKKLSYEKGVLPRLIEQCAQEKDRTFVFNLENIEALPGRVRAQLNTFLLTGEMWVPDTEKEEDRRIYMPENLRIIGTMNEKAVLEDGAFYDRFIRKTIPACTKGDLEEAIRLRHPSFEKDVAHVLVKIKTKFDERKLPSSPMDFMRIADYVAGRIKLGKAGGEPVDEIKTAFKETLHYFQAAAKNRNKVVRYNASIFSVLSPMADELTFNQGNLLLELGHDSIIRYSAKSREILFGGVGLKINKKIAGKIERALQKNGQPQAPQKQEEIIKEVLIDELDFVITDEEKKMLASIARNYNFGNRVILLEGTTGAGKTYTAEALSKLLDFSGRNKTKRYYAEPIHSRTKLSRFVGAFRADEYGYYSLDSTTDFLDSVRNGGITALSELNTAVKDDYAKLGWWFIQFARGDETIYLTEYPGYGPDEALSPSVARSKESLIVIDINPGDYEARGKLPEDLMEYIPRVHVEKPTSADDIKKVTDAFLKHVKDARTREDVSRFLADTHFALQTDVENENKKGNRHAPLTFRELRRVARCIDPDDTGDEAMNKAKQAINTYYIAAFKDVDKQRDLRNRFGIAERDIKDVVEDLLFDGKGPRAPPTLVFSPAEEDPFQELDEIIKGRDDVYREKVQVTYFTDEFKLFGGYIPISRDVDVQRAREFISRYMKDEESIKKAQEVYKKLTGKNLPSVIPAPDQGQGQASAGIYLNHIPPRELVSLSVALDALRNNEAWRPKLKYERGIIPRLIQEARNNPKKTHIIAFENFHRIRPGLAVAMNTILQEGYYYDPLEGKPVTIPGNLRFFATAVHEAQLPVSMAEESRWVRVYKGEKNRHEKASLLKNYSIELFHRKFGLSGRQIIDIAGRIVDSISQLLGDYNLSDHKAFINGVVGELKHSDDYGRGKLAEFIDKHKFLVYGTAVSEQQRQARSIAKKDMREYFNAFTAGKTPKLETEDDELLVEIDELVEIEAATFQAFGDDRIVIYEGPPGGGKTDMAIDVARRMGLDHYVYSCHGRVHAADLLGGFIQDDEGKFILTGVADENGDYRYNPFLQMLTHGGVFIFDEGAIGRRSQELISLLSSLARGEKVFVMNDIPGRPPELLNVHEDFHVIITMNPVEETPGREPLPLEVYEHAKKVWVSNRLVRDSYRKLIERFTERACSRHGLRMKDVFGMRVFPNAFADFICAVHNAINDLIGVSISLEENMNLHLLTLRDMKKTVDTFVEYISKGVDSQEALRIALRVEYINQFNKNKDRPITVRELKTVFLGRERRLIVDFLRKQDIDVRKLIDNLSRKLDKKFLKDTKEEPPQPPVAPEDFPFPHAPRPAPEPPPLPGGLTQQDLEKPRDFAEPKEIFDRDITKKEMEDGYGGRIESAFEFKEAEIETVTSDRELDRIEPEEIGGDKGYMYTKKLEGKLKPVKQDITVVKSLPPDAEERVAAGETFMYEETLTRKGLHGRLEAEFPSIVNYRDSSQSLSELYANLKGHTDLVLSLTTIKVDGEECLVSGSGDNTIKLWNLSNRTVTTLKGHTGRVWSLTTIRVDGEECLVSGSGDNTIKLWNLSNGTATTLKGHTQGVLSLTTIRVNGEECLVSASNDNTIKLWNLSNGTATTLKGHTGWGCSLTTIRVDGEECLVSASNDNTIKLWNLSNGTATTLKGHTGWVSSLTTIRVDGEECLVSGSYDNTIKLWNLSNGTVTTLKGHTGRVWSLTTIRVDGEECLVSGSEDKIIKLWNLVLQDDVKEAIRIMDEWERAQLALSRHRPQYPPQPAPEPPRLPGGLTPQDLKKPQKFAEPKEIFDGEISEDQAMEGYGGIITRDTLVTERRDVKTVVSPKEFDQIEPDTIAEYEGYMFSEEVIFSEQPAGKGVSVKKPVTKVAPSFTVMSSDIEAGRTFMYEETLDKTGITLPGVIDHRFSGRALTELYKSFIGHDTHVASLTGIRIDGKEYLASGDSLGAIRLWDLSGEETVTVLKGHIGEVCALTTVTIKGKECLVSGGRDKTIKIWDLSEGEETVTTLRGYTDRVYALTSMRINGRDYLVSGSSDKTIKLWDIFEGGKTVITLKGHTGDIESLIAVTMNGKECLGSAGLTELKAWDITKGKETVTTLKYSIFGPGASLTTLTADGKQYLASVELPDSVALLDLSEGTVKILRGHTGTVRFLTTIKAGGKEYLASGSEDKTIKIWDVSEEGKCVTTLKGHTSAVTVLTAVKTDEEEYLASAGRDGTIRLWDLTFQDTVKEALEIMDKRRTVEPAQSAAGEFPFPPGITLDDLEKPQNFAETKEITHGGINPNDIEKGYAGITGDSFELAEEEIKEPGFDIVTSVLKWTSPVRLIIIDLFILIAANIMAALDKPAVLSSLYSLPYGMFIFNALLTAALLLIDMGFIWGLVEIMDFLRIPLEMGGFPDTTLERRKDEKAVYMSIKKLSGERGPVKKPVTRAREPYPGYLTAEQSEKIGAEEAFMYEETLQEALHKAGIAFYDHKSSSSTLEELCEILKIHSDKPSGTALVTLRLDRKEYLVFGDAAGAIKLFDLSEGEGRVKTLVGHTGAVTSLTTMRINGKECLVSGSSDNTIKLWDLSEGRETVTTLRGHSEGRETDSIKSLATIRMDGKEHLVSGSNGGTIQLWDFSEGRETVTTLKGGHAGGIISLTTVMMNGRECFVSLGNDRVIKIWDLSGEKKTVITIKGDSYPVASLTTITIGETEYLASIAPPGGIQLWNLAGKTVKNLIGHNDARCLTTITTEGKEYLVSGGDDKTVKLWDLSGGRETVKTLRGHTGGVVSLTAITIDGKKRLVSRDAENTFRFWDVALEDTILRTIDEWERAKWAWSRRQYPPAPEPPPLPEGITEADLAKPLNFAEPKEVSDKEAAVGVVENKIRRWGPVTWFSRKIFAITVADLPVVSFICVTAITAVFKWIFGIPLVPDTFIGFIGDMAWWLIGVVLIHKFLDIPIYRDILIRREIFGKKEKETPYDEDADMIVRKLKGGYEPVKRSVTRVRSLDECKQGDDGGAFIYEEPLREVLRRSGVEFIDHKSSSFRWEELCEILKIRSGGVYRNDLVTLTLSGKEYLVFGDTDGAIRLFDLSGREGRVKTLIGHTGAITSLTTVKIDGKEHLASGSEDKTIKLWDLSEGRETVRTLRGHTGIIHCLAAIKIDGKEHLASGSADKTIKLWDISEKGVTVKTLRAFKHEANFLTTIVIDGKEHLASGGLEGTVRLWDFSGKGGVVTTLMQISSGTGMFLSPGAGAITCLTAVKTGEKTYLAFGDLSGGDIKLWDPSGRKESVTILEGHTGVVTSLAAITIDGKEYLASGCDDKTVRVWDLSEGEKTVRTLRGHTEGIESLTAIAIDGKRRLVSGDRGNTFRFWDLTIGKTVTEVIHKWERGVDEWERAQLALSRQRAAPAPGAKKKEQEPVIDLPEDDSITETRYALRGTGRVLLIMEPGGRERVVINEVVKEENIEKVYSLEGAPVVTAYDIFGGLSPVLENEIASAPSVPRNDMGRTFVYKKGFFTRHMMDEEEYRDSLFRGKDKMEPILLVIHNIDAIPEKVRAAINNLLLNGYIDIPGDRKYYLPDHIKVIATVNASSQQDFSSAFPNRFTKVYVNKMETRCYGVSEFKKYCMQVYDLDEDTIDGIENVYLMIKRLEGRGYIWPSGNAYDFTVKDALTHTQFVSLGIEERKRAKLSLSGKDISKIVIREAVRVYGARLKEYTKDYKNFVETILPLLFKNKADIDDAVSPDFSLLSGKLDSLSDIPLVPSEAGEHPCAVDRRYRLTLVGSIVKVMSSIVRGFQARKVVSLAGETGAAKTTMGVAIAKFLGLDYYIFSMHKDVKAHELTAGIRMTDRGTYRMELSEFVKRLRRGNTVLVVDEANIKPEVLWILAGIARGDRKFTIEIPGDEPLSFEIGKNVFVLFTMNPEDYGGGRSSLPRPIKEDVFNIWAPSEYPDAEFEAIVNEFFDGFAALDNFKQVTEEESGAALLRIDGRMLDLLQYMRHGYARATVSELMELIEDRGHTQALMELLRDPDREARKRKRKELQELEREILEMPMVQERMDKIRTLVGVFSPDVTVRFSLYKWWSITVDGKVINVPLYWLVDYELEDGTRRVRSDEVITGLILHEIWHKLYTPTGKEWGEIASGIKGLTAEEKRFIQAMAGDKDKCDPAFHRLWNAVEDIRIDQLSIPRLKGAGEYFHAMNKEFFEDKLEFQEEKKEATLQLAGIQPHKVLVNELLCYGYNNGRHSAYFEYLPDELKNDIMDITEGKGLLARATTGDAVIIDFGKVESDSDLRKEKLRAAAESMKIIIKEITPVYRKWVERAKKPDKGEPSEGPPSFVDLPPEMAEDFEPGGPADDSILTEGGVIISVPGAASGDEGAGEGAVPFSGDAGDAGAEEGVQEGEHPGDSGAEDEGAGGRPSGESPSTRADSFDGAARKITKKRKEEMKAEPFNQRLSEVSDLGKRLADGLINIFKLPEEPGIDESAFGRIINAVRFLTGSNVPFDEDVEQDGKPDLALGFTIDASGSMRDFYDALRQLSAIMLSCFQQIGNKGEFSITVDTDKPHTIKEFHERFSQEELNGAQSKTEKKISESGRGIHLYECVEVILDKYERCEKRNKMEVIFTDGLDTGGDLEWAGDQIKCSERLNKLFQKAERMGIDIIGVGFGTQNIKLFNSYVQLDKEHGEAIVGMLLNLARIKARTGKIPKGDLGGVFDLSRKGTMKKSAAERAVPEERKITIVKREDTVEEVRPASQRRRGQTPKSGAERGRGLTLNLEKRVAAVQTVMPDIWRNTTKDIIILPETEWYKATETGVRNRVRRKMRKKHEQTVVTFGYVFNKRWKSNLEEIVTKAVRELEKGNDKTRALAYIPRLVDGDDKDFMEELLRKEDIAPFAHRITFIQQEGIKTNEPIDVVMHIILGIALLNYERYRKKDYKIPMSADEEARLIELIKTMVSDPELVDSKFLEGLMKGMEFLKIRKVDFSTITHWREMQNYVLTSV